ncbi:helix-turn-helix transcriptional regulator [Kitasatospora sp. NBC_01266]
MFLRSRRDRTTPATVGLPTDTERRRTPGLRRAELAKLAGISPTWYQWLEQARPIPISRHVLQGLATALRLTEEETAHLFQLAGETPPVRCRVTTAQEVPEQYRQLLERLTALPAYILSHRFDILAWNSAFEVLLPHFGTLRAGERNLLLITFDERAPEIFPDWEERARDTVIRFRTHAVEQLAQPEVAELVSGLCRRSPEFRRLWSQADVGRSDSSVQSFEHPLLGRIKLDTVCLQTAPGGALMVINQPLPGSHLAAQFAGLVEQRRRAGRHPRVPAQRGATHREAAGLVRQHRQPRPGTDHPAPGRAA